MRLINTQTLELAEFFDSKIPKYAILSHTWEDEEVTFEEWACSFQRSVSSQFTLWTALQSVIGPQVREAITKKAGYRKVKRAAELAASRGHQWLWADTCCINKASSSELSESINTMYRYYSKAAECYAYLCDVKSISPTDLPASRWFTRGWTLQELLAPKYVTFYNHEWNVIGKKTDLTSQIASITRIHQPALSLPGLIESYSVAQRMSWASTRQVTRAEDMAYCLLGIMDVNMPLLYGEGGRRAFTRLQKQILDRYNDDSILAWGRMEHALGRPLANDRIDASHWAQSLATSPKAFAASTNIAYSANSPDGIFRPFSVGTNGIHISVFSRRVPSHTSQIIYEAVLNCSIATTGSHTSRLPAPAQQNKLVLVRLVTFPQVNVFRRDGGFWESSEQLNNPKCGFKLKDFVVVL